jgi:hypothetical protein
MFVTYTERVGDEESVLSMSGSPEEIIEFYLAVQENVEDEYKQSNFACFCTADFAELIEDKIREVIQRECRSGGMLHN